jgi:hypothetical protein
MIHGKKMVLVPFESYNAEDQTPKAPAPVGDFSLMDEEMNSILKNKHLNEDDKWIKYNQILQRYMTKLQRGKRDISVALQDSDDDSENDEEISSLKIADTVATPQKPDMVDLLNRVRQTRAQRTRAERMYNLLDKCSNIKWNTVGETIIGNKNVGNIGELIQNCLVKNPKVPLEGWKGFTGFLKSVNVPISYVTNVELKDLLRGEKTKTGVSSRLKAKRARTNAVQNWVPYP